MYTITPLKNDTFKNDALFKIRRLFTIQQPGEVGGRRRGISLDETGSPWNWMGGHGPGERTAPADCRVSYFPAPC